MNKLLELKLDECKMDSRIKSVKVAEQIENTILSKYIFQIEDESFKDHFRARLVDSLDRSLRIHYSICGVLSEKTLAEYVIIEEYLLFLGYNGEIFNMCIDLSSMISYLVDLINMTNYQYKAQKHERFLQNNASREEVGRILIDIRENNNEWFNHFTHDAGDITLINMFNVSIDYLQYLINIKPKYEEFFIETSRGNINIVELNRLGMAKVPGPIEGEK